MSADAHHEEIDRVVVWLRQHPGDTIIDIAVGLGLTRQDTTYYVDHLLKHGSRHDEWAQPWGLGFEIRVGQPALGPYPDWW